MRRGHYSTIMPEPRLDRIPEVPAILTETDRLAPQLFMVLFLQQKHDQTTQRVADQFAAMIDKRFCSARLTSGRGPTPYRMTVWIDADRLGMIRPEEHHGEDRVRMQLQLGTPFPRQRRARASGLR